MKRALLLLSLGVAIVGITGLSSLQSARVYAVPASLRIVADAKSDVCAGIGLVGSGGSCGDSGAQANTAISAAINILSLVVGVASVAMVIVAGLKFVTSGGDANKAASARNTILYAIIGMVVVAMAQVIVHFVLGKVK